MIIYELFLVFSRRSKYDSSLNEPIQNSYKIRFFNLTIVMKLKS